MGSVVRIIKRGKKSDPKVSQSAKIIVNALIFAACLGGNDFAFVAAIVICLIALMKPMKIYVNADSADAAK
jgi:hypothetical protein